VKPLHEIAAWQAVAGLVLAMRREVGNGQTHGAETAQNGWVIAWKPAATGAYVEVEVSWPLPIHGPTAHKVARVLAHLGHPIVDWDEPGRACRVNYFPDAERELTGVADVRAAAAAEIGPMSPEEAASIAAGGQS